MNLYKRLCQAIDNLSADCRDGNLDPNTVKNEIADVLSDFEVTVVYEDAPPLAVCESKDLANEYIRLSATSLLESQTMKMVSDTTEVERKQALAKLTQRERELLGLN